MDQTKAMSMGESRCEFQANGGQNCLRKAAELTVESANMASTDDLHHEKEMVVLRAAVSKELDDIGVIEGRHGFGFTLEPLAIFFFAGKLAVEYLDGNISCLDRIVG